VSGDLEIDLLGPPRLLIAGREVTITSDRVRAALAVLAVNAGRAVTVETLLRLIWGDRPTVNPRASLQTVVNRLRGLVGPEVVQTTVDGYRLDVPPDAVDALRLEWLLARAGGLAADRARVVLDEAFALWRGAPFGWPGGEALAVEVGPALVERHLAVVERRVDLDLESGGYDEAIDRLREVLAEYSLRESLWVRLVMALRDAGRPAEARQAYETVRVMLADALGTDPSPELAEVFRSLGPVGVAELAPEGQPRQLPSGLADFTGRSVELGWLDRMFADAERRGSGLVAAVHGPGGAGKTSLALCWAHRVAGRFPDGQLYVNLGGYGPDEPLTASAALDLMLRSVGTPPRRIPTGTEERSGLLRTALADRRLLIVLDDAGDAGQVRPLLVGGASVTVVTSRADLTGLAVRDGAVRLMLAEMTDAESVELLSRSVGPERAAAEPAAVVELARLCGNLPLALAIGAQQVNRYPAEALTAAVAGLGVAADRIDALGDADDPRTDLRAVFSRSYRALDSETARAFRYLGLHPAPSVGLPLAAALLGVELPSARRLLDRLASEHLLECRSPGRYRLYDLLRGYARRLAADTDPPADLDRAAVRMLDWYLHTLRQARDRLFTPLPLDFGQPADDTVRPHDFPDGWAGMRWFDSHRATLLALLRFATEQGHPQYGWRLAALMQVLLSIRLHTEDLLTITAAGLECAERTTDPVALVWAYQIRNAALETAGRRDEALEAGYEMLRLAERSGRLSLVAHAQMIVGLSLRLTGGARPFDDSLEWLRRSVVTAERASAQSQLALCLLNLGSVEGMAGRPGECAEHTEQAVWLYRLLGSSYHRALALGNLAEARLDLGDHEAALSAADEALDVLGDLDDRLATTGALVVKGRLLAAGGQPTEAIGLWRRALAILERAEDPRAAEVRRLLTDADGQDTGR
jgi:DNA-binding SARP family transcriptional activator